MAGRNGELKERPRAGGAKAAARPAGPVAVVGVGVCLRSFASLQHLFADLPGKLGAAYLVAVRQQDGLSVDEVVTALRARAAIPVSIVGDGEPLEPDRVYVGGRDALITVEDGHVRSVPAENPLGRRGTVDSLLLSLSEAFAERSVAVVLAGLGSDGTAGVAATKSRGGLAIAEGGEGEEPAAEAVTAAGIADLRIPVEQIPGQVAAYVRNMARVDEAGGWEALQAQAAEHITHIANILRNSTGNDFHGYKQNTFLRRVGRRMQVVGVEQIDAYIALLKDNPAEVQHLFQDLLIGVTQFFRDAPEFAALEREAIPNIIKGKTADDHVRVWVVGCATGEEAYSLAIALREAMAEMDAAPHVQIFATDLDSRALAVARAGRYAEGQLQQQVSPERLARWFVREGTTYCVSKQLREMCIFSPHNVLKDAPFSRMDLVSCRNLLIYLNTELQSRVIPIFHFSLRQGGYLFLGNSENATRHAKLFASVDRKNRVFRRLETAARVLPDFPLASRVRRPDDHEPAPPPRRRGPAPQVSRRAEQAVERYAPAYVVVDEGGEVLHFSGRTGRYLEPAPGAATLNVLNLVHRELRLDLRSALQRAASGRERVETPRVPLTIDGQPVAVNMVLEPLAADEEPGSLVVLFQEAPLTHGVVAAEPPLATDEHVQRLEADLRVTKDRLQATIEELESTNEELKSSNEEYQSINEELQSANEELETSKEELQSVNEELQTVNHELASRVGELGRTNSDLKNLLESTQIATVFLDNDLRVRSFTPAATEVFHLLETDVGRPLGHIAARVAYPELQDDARRVLKDLAPVERAVAGDGDRRFAARVLPYRSVDNFIAGVVVTFLDVTATARAEAALREGEARHRAELEQQVRERTAELKQSRDFLQATMDASTDMIQVFDAVRDANGEIVDFRWTLNNHTSEARHGEVRVGESLLTRNPGVVEEGIFDTFKRVAETGEPEIAERHYVHEQFNGWFLQSVVKLGDGVATTTKEIDDWKRAQEEVIRLRDEVAQTKLRESEERYRLIVESARDYAIFTTDPDGLITSWPAGAQAVFGWSAEEVVGRSVAITFTPEDLGSGVPEQERADAREQGQSANVRWHVRKDGSRVFIDGVTRPLPEGDGFLKVGRDATAARAADERQRMLLAELQHRVRNTLAVVRSVARRTADSSADVEDYARHLDGRINALARTQAVLTRSPGHGVGLANLIMDELLAYGAREDQLEVSGPEVRLQAKAGETLGLVIHELATNAVKYGALSVAGGRVAVTWTIEPNGTVPRLKLAWRETGVPIVSGGPRRRGFGQELIERTTPYELGATAELSFEPGGVCCRIDMPMNGRNVVAPGAVARGADLMRPPGEGGPDGR